MTFKGNIVTPDGTFFGELNADGRFITAINADEEIRDGADWIVPGFVDIHVHGMDRWSAEEAGGVANIVQAAPLYGVTVFCPTLASNTETYLIETIRKIRHIPAMPGARIGGVHLEGPWLNPRCCGAMAPGMIRPPTVREAEHLLDAADGILKIVTCAPELEGAQEVMKLLDRAGVRLSAGHSGLRPEEYESAIAGGIKQFCHLFDVYDDSESSGGVRQPAVTDLALCDDRVMKELVMDGLHVPPPLVELARRAAGAEHIIAITDAMQGAGLKHGRFREKAGWYIIRDGDVARREADNCITGSSLTMNRVFHNMVKKFGFTPQEAAQATSANPAAALGLGNICGQLKPGFMADITVLAPDLLTVRSCSAAAKAE